MIKQVTYYDIICDSCGKSFSFVSNTCYPDTESAEMTAIFSGDWVVKDCKHYCPNCYEFDEETKKYNPKKGGKQLSKTTYCGECENSSTKIQTAMVSAKRPTRNVAALTSAT